MSDYPVLNYLRLSKLLLIFDLDGTLIDSREDLAISTNAMRAQFNLPPLHHDVIQSYVGNGAAMLVKRALGTGASEERVNDAVDYFLRFYRTHSLQNTRLYNGVSEAISALNDEGHGLAVLTNKPHRISVDILDALGLGTYFSQVYGGDSFPEKKPNPVGIITLLHEHSTPATSTWMIGDSGVDIQTARNAGVRACGVTWGFQPDAFTDDPPDLLVETPDEWLRLARAV